MAIWQKVFSRRNWQNRPSTATPLNETNLNVGDAALDTIDDRVIELNNRTNELEGYETAAAQSAAEAAQSESNAEAWAVGQRDGTDVPSSDDTYHNNSKYYSGMAQSYAVGTNGTVRPGDATDNAKYYYEQAQTVVADSLHDRGTTLFANLPTTNLIEGDIYKITDSFTTDSRFQIGAGVVIPANVSFYYGTNEKWNSFGGTGGGGHEIQNNSGTTMTQRDALQFKGLDVTDDSTNGRTVVEYKKEIITYQTWEGYSDAQKQSYRGLISNYPGLGLTSAETCMRASGTETVEQSLVSVASDISELRSHVGLIIHSTTLDTEAKVKAIYGGTHWIQHSGYMLRGATSGVTANDATKTGGEDSVTLTAAQSGVPAHSHSVSAFRANFTYDNVDTVGNNGIRLGSQTLPGAGLTIPDHNTNNNTAQNASEAHNNIPNYKSVYIWERTE